MPTVRQERATARRREIERFRTARITERAYMRQLVAVGRHVGDIVKGFTSNGLIDDTEPLTTALRAYARLLTPWATAVTERMHAEASRRDLRAWKSLSYAIGSGVRREIETAPTGAILKLLLNQQVKLITSLPSDAADRVHELTLRRIVNGVRAEETAKDILATGHVTMARAMLIGRTETSRTASNLTQARAEYIGSTHYLWHGIADSEERPEHLALNGTVHAWNEPPIASAPGAKVQRYHPGCGPNCFIGSTVVSLAHGCHNLWRYWYEGALVCIQLDDAGTLIEVTPNHPILTGRGWVAAKDIQAGDHVIQSLQENRVSLEHHKDNSEITFDQLFAALEVAVGREVNIPALFDFHGDIPENDVDAIRADHLLPGYGVSASLQSICDSLLSRSNGGVVQIPQSGVLEVGESFGPSSFDQRFAPIVGKSLHPQNVGLASVSNCNTVVGQNAVDNEPSALEGGRESLGALSSLIASADARLVHLLLAVKSCASSYRTPPPNAEMLAQAIRGNSDDIGSLEESVPAKYKPVRVINVGSRDYAGHVFTMETSSGWFGVTSASIVSKNCRCWAEPILPAPRV